MKTPSNRVFIQAGSVNYKHSLQKLMCLISKYKLSKFGHQIQSFEVSDLSLLDLSSFEMEMSYLPKLVHMFDSIRVCKKN